VGQSLAFDKLHHQKHGAVVFKEVEYVDQPWMLEGCEDAGFLLELLGKQLLQDRIVPTGLQHLDGDGPVSQVNLVSQVHGPHAALPSQSFDTISVLQDNARIQHLTLFSAWSWRTCLSRTADFGPRGQVWMARAADIREDFAGVVTVKKVVVQVQWSRRDGWCYRAYEFEAAIEDAGTLTPTKSGRLSQLVPGLDDKETSVTVREPERIRQAVLERFPGAQVELGPIPANLG
jgi:hypothetical protein